MQMFSQPSTPDRLNSILDQERQMILEGNLDALPRLAKEKTRLLSRTPLTPNDAGVWARLRAKADRNQALLAATAQGIKAATRHLKALTGEQTRMRTYDQGGKSRDLSETRSSIERRA